MTDFSGVLTAVPLVALFVSACALGVSLFALLQSRKTSLLNARREVIDHLRAALYDIQIHGAIRDETVASVRDAYQLSTLVFGKQIEKTLEEAFAIAFRLSHKPEDRWSDKDYEDREALLKALGDAFGAMKAKASIS